MMPAKQPLFHEASADMSQNTSASMPPLLLLAILLAGGGGFLYMVKLMHDMTGHVGQMAADMSLMSANLSKMQQDMATLTQEVREMLQQVATLPGMAADMQQMRVAIGRMSGIFGGGESMRQINPLELMQQLMPGGERR